MRVKRIGYLGFRSRDTEGMTRFFRELLGLEAAGQARGLTRQRFRSHQTDRVEVFAPGHRDPTLIPDGADFVVGFVVDDIREALADARAAGVEVLGESGSVSDLDGGRAVGGVPRFWVRTAEGRVFAFEEARD